MKPVVASFIRSHYNMNFALSVMFAKLLNIQFVVAVGEYLIWGLEVDDNIEPIQVAKRIDRSETVFFVFPCGEYKL